MVKNYKKTIANTIALASLTPYLFFLPPKETQTEIPQPHSLEERAEVRPGRGSPNESLDLVAIANYITSNEGRRLEVYDPIPHDGKDEPTIGIGHYLC